MLQHPEVRYEVTDFCNAHCVMCPRDKHDRAHGVMDQEQYERSIDEVVKLGARQVTLTGFGEPLLDRKLERKIRYAKDKGLKTYIISNGSLLRARAEKLADSGLDELRISFYGMSKKTYNAIMQGLDFQKSREGILKFLDIRKNTKVQISYLIFPENENYLSFLEYWEPLVDYVEVWKPHNFSSGRKYRDIHGPKTTCGRPARGALQIQWDGKVVPCCYDFDSVIVLGNAFEQPIVDILNGTPYIKLRDAHEKGEFWHYPLCDGCDQLQEHSDALIYTNRHNLPKEIAVQLDNTSLTNLKGGANAYD